MPTPLTSGRHAEGVGGRYEVVAPVELADAEKAVIDQQIAQTEADPESSVSTALRWGRAQLDVVRRAARLTGVPYQTCLKEAAFRCAVADLRAAREAGVEAPWVRRSV